MTAGDDHAGGHTPLFYVVDWLPPDFGAVGQYGLIAAQKLASAGREVHLVGLTRGPGSQENLRIGAGNLSIQRLHARSYEKTKFVRRLFWTLWTDLRLTWTVLRNRRSHGADVQFTGSPPFMLYFAFALKFLRRARLIYRITDFYPEAIIAHLGRKPFLLRVLERTTWFLRRRVDCFEVLGLDQTDLLRCGGIPDDRIRVARDSAPVPITGRESPAPRPPTLTGRKVLLYSGNYGVAHDVETVIDGLVQHHRTGSGRFGLWLNATGQNADLIEQRLKALAIPVARTAPVPLVDLPALLAAADVHLIALRTEFSGIVLPSKVYACIQSKRPILFVGPTTSDVHLLCTQAGVRYEQVTPGDSVAFARALEKLSGD